MAAEQVRLEIQLDTGQVISGTARMEREFTQSTSRMDAASKKVERGVSSLGQSAKLAARGMTAMSAAIGAGTAATAASERQWLALGTVILSSFAAGGPVAGAIASFAAAIGLLSTRTTEADRAAAAARKQYEEWLEVIVSKGAKARDELTKIRNEQLGARIGVSGDTFQAMRDSNRADFAVTSIGLQLRSKREELADLEARLPSLTLGSRTAALMGIERLRGEVRGLEKDLKEAESAAAALNRRFEEMKLDAANQRALAQREFDVQAERQIEDIRSRLNPKAAARAGEVAIARQIRDLEREKENAALGLIRYSQAHSLELDRQIAKLTEILGIERATNDQLEQRQAAEKASADLAKLRQQSLAQAQALIDGLGSTLSQGLSDLIMDGIVTGFENSRQIALNIVHTLLSQIIQQLVSSGIQQLFSSLFGGGGGGLFGGGGGGGILGAVTSIAGGGGISPMPSADPGWLGDLTGAVGACPG